MSVWIRPAHDDEIDAIAALNTAAVGQSAEGKIVRSVRTRSARLQQAHIELPEQPKSASFFTVIGQASKGNADDDNDGGQAAAG